MCYREPAKYHRHGHFCGRQRSLSRTQLCVVTEMPESFIYLPMKEISWLQNVFRDGGKVIIEENNIEFSIGAVGWSCWRCWFYADEADLAS